MNCHCLTIPYHERCFTTFISGSELAQSSMYDLSCLQSKTIDFSSGCVQFKPYVAPHQLINCFQHLRIYNSQIT